MQLDSISNANESFHGECAYVECLKSIGKEEEPAKHHQAIEETIASKPAVQPAQSSEPSGEKPVESVAYRIHLPNRSYKSVRTTTHTSGEMVLESLCEKLNLSKDASKYLALFERVKDRERRVKNTEMIADIVRMWPMILGETGNETYKQCYFLAAPLATAPDYVLSAVNMQTS